MAHLPLQSNSSARSTIQPDPQHLIKNDGTGESRKIEESYEERLRYIREYVTKQDRCVTENLKSIEKQAEQISELQVEIECLQNLVKANFSTVLSDEELATAINEPVHKVKQWRETCAVDINDKAFVALGKYEVFGSKWIER